MGPNFESNAAQRPARILGSKTVSRVTPGQFRSVCNALQCSFEDWCSIVTRDSNWLLSNGANASRQIPGDASRIPYSTGTSLVVALINKDS